MPGPRLHIKQTASPEEAAAIVAAIRRFRDDHAPVIAPARPSMTPWQRAALMEGVGLESDAPWHATPLTTPR